MSRQTLTFVVVAAVILVGAVFVYSVMQRDEGSVVPENISAPVATEEERAVEARDVISRLQEGDRVDFTEAFDTAQEYQQTGRLADAQMLYFYGARGNHAPSAFALATMNDPNHHNPETSLLPKPDPFQAYKWYVVARDQGMADAAERLDALHAWAEEAADSGDAQAEQLLLQWK
jgi:hypothetical protein